MAEPVSKRARAGGTMPADLRDVIEKSLAAIIQVEYRKRNNKKSNNLRLNWKKILKNWRKEKKDKNEWPESKRWNNN